MLTECFLSSGKEKYRPEIFYLDDTENGDDDTNPVDMELAEGIPISGAGSGYDEQEFEWTLATDENRELELGCDGKPGDKVEKHQIF